ncbi:VWA domain-containing protein [Streptomyces sp. NPDC005047]
MGILTLLRNAFGRSRKEQTAPAEGATQETAPPVTAPEPKLPSQPTAPPETTAQPESTQVPEPRSESTPDEHDLVKAAFTNVSVPKPTSEQTPEPKAEPTTPETTAAPAPEADAEPTPEAEAAPTPEAAPAPKPKPDPKPKAESDPAPTAEAEPEATPKAKATPEPKPEPKPKADVETKPQEAPEPAAADGDEAPQGPPAPDNESSTGGAGGNEDSEGEAEETHPQPEATPKPATTAARIRSRAPALTTAYKAAATTLKTHDLTGTRAKVHLVLDRSASMRPYFKDGSAQALAEQTLALAAHLDPEATVHVTFFSTELDGTGDLTLTDHENKIDELHAALGRMGRTSYHAAVEAVLAHHEKEAPGTPALVVFQTDGAPDAKTPATQALTDAAKNHPDVHFSFVAFGDPENKAFDYLRKLKTGNTSHFLAGETPKELTDEELYEGVLATWRP